MTILPDLEEQLVRAAGDLGARPPAAPTHRFGLGRLGGAVAVVTAVGVVAAVVVVIASVGERSHPAAAPPGSAAGTLDEAARAAAKTSAPKLQHGQAWYTEEVRVHTSPALPGAPLPGRFGRSVWTWQSWNGASGSVSGGFISGGGAAGAPGFDQWSGSFIPEAALRSPGSLLRALNGFGGYFNYNVPGGSPVEDTDTSSLTKLAKAAALLGGIPLRPTQRAVVFRAIAQLPGLAYLGPARDPLGRLGVAVAAEGSPRVLDVNKPQRYQLELIFEPSTGRVLGFRTTALESVREAPLANQGVPTGHYIRAGQLMFAWAYEHAGLVAASELPRLVCTAERSPASCEAIVSHAINKHTARRPPASASAPVHRFRTPVNGTLTVNGTGIAHINLTSPDHRRLPEGTAEVSRNGKQYAVIVVAGGLNQTARRGTYALWLTGGPNQRMLLGIVNPGAGPASHSLRAAGPVPADVLSYRRLVITLEYNAHPSIPGQVILQGPLTR